MRLLLFTLSLLFFFSACSTKGVKAYKEEKKTSKTSAQSPQPTYKPKQKNWITSALYKEYIKWHKTPYKYGGTSFDGVDCSSFIQNVYYDAFKIKLPRTTKAQAKKGYFIKRVYLKEGDLIFFKTSYSDRHAGILIEKDKFIHASTKHGVTISSLHNPYWRDKYWQSRRLLPSD